MAFSLGGLLGGIGGLASGISSIFGVGGAKKQKKPPRGPGSFGFPSTTPTAAPTQVSPLFQQAVFRPPSLPRGTFQPVAAGPVPTVIAGARSLTALILGRASAAVGKRMTSRSVMALVKQVGLVAAAAALAIGIEEIAQIVATIPPRRRRGISAANIRTTKRVIRTIHSISHDLGHLAPPRRRAGVRHHHHKG